MRHKRLSIYRRAELRHGRILGPTIGALEAMRRLEDPWTPPTQPVDTCDHSLTYCPNLSQGDTTRFCEYCGLEYDGQDTIRGEGYATLPRLTLERLQELHNLRRLVHRIAFEAATTEVLEAVTPGPAHVDAVQTIDRLIREYREAAKASRKA